MYGGEKEQDKEEEGERMTSTVDYTDLELDGDKIYMVWRKDMPKNFPYLKILVRKNKDFITIEFPDSDKNESLTMILIPFKEEYEDDEVKGND